MSHLLDRLTLRAKILVLAGVLLVFLAVVGITGVRSLGSVERISGSMYADRVVPLRDLGETRALLGDIDSQIQRAITDRDRSNQQGYADAVAKDRAAVEKILEAYAATKLVPAEETGLETFRGAWAEYQKAYAAVLRPARENRSRAAADAYFAGADSLYGEADAALKKLVTVNDDVAADANAEIKAKWIATRTVIVLTLFAILLGIGFAFFVATAVRRSVRRVIDRLAQLRDQDVAGLTGALEAIAQGDLTVAVASTTEPPRSPPTRSARSLTWSTRSARRPDLDGGLQRPPRARRDVGPVRQSSQTLSPASQQMASTSEEAGRAVGEIAGGRRRRPGRRAPGALGRGRQEATEEVARRPVVRRTAAETAQAATEARRVASGARGRRRGHRGDAPVRDSSPRRPTPSRARRKSEQIGGIVDDDHRHRRADEPARAQRRDRGRPRRRAGPRVRGRRRGGPQARRGVAGGRGLDRDLDRGDPGRDAAVTVVENGSARTEEGAATVEQARDAFGRIGAAVDDMTARVDAIAAAGAAGRRRRSSRQDDMAESRPSPSSPARRPSRCRPRRRRPRRRPSRSPSAPSSSPGTADELEQLVGRFTITA